MGPLGWTRRGFVLSEAEGWAISLEGELEANKWTQSPQARKDDKRKSNNPPKRRRSKKVAAYGFLSWASAVSTLTRGVGLRLRGPLGHFNWSSEHHQIP